MKFTPEPSKFPKNFAGFWKLDKEQTGAVVRGVIRDVTEGEFGKGLLIELGKNEFGAAVSLIVERRARDTNDKIDYTAKAGEVVGVNMKANLRGLDKFVGHEVSIKYLGKFPTDGGGDEHRFDTDIGGKAKQEEKPKGATKSAGA